MKRYTITLGIIVVAIAIVMIGLGIQKQQKQNAPVEESSNFYTEKSISHIHGMSVDIADPNKVYIATHDGLFILVNNKNLYRVGESKDDYMGFSPHPKDPSIFFTSGHPLSGGNMGVQKSEDGGATWKKISDGENGPVDFHAMAISQTNPDELYGWFDNSLQRSDDGGYTWKIIESKAEEKPRPIGVLNLVTHPTNENVLYATTISPDGVIVSEDKGESWKVLSEDTKNNIVITLAVKSDNPDVVVGFSYNDGVIRSSDGGKTWEKTQERFGDDIALYLEFSKSQPETIYAATKKNKIYKSSDSGKSWSQIF